MGVISAECLSTNGNTGKVIRDTSVKAGLKAHE